MVLDNLQSMDALFGMTQTGGKPKTRKTAKTGKTVKTVKTVKKAVKAGTKKVVKAGAVSEYSCFCLNPSEDPVMIDGIRNYQAKKTRMEVAGQVAPAEVANAEVANTEFDDVWANNKAQELGNIKGGMSKMQYKAYLAKMDVKRLYKIAKGKGIKITKKKDGKTTYIKKDTVIQKLCDAMHGKKK